MARKDGPTENQHYVPKLLLREFAVPRKKEWYINAFDKKSKRSFRTNIKNIAAEHGFYDISVAGQTVAFELYLSQLETQTAGAFKKLLRHQDVGALDDEDRSWIGVFLAAQHMRVTNFRAVLLETNDKFCDMLRNMGADPNDVKGFTPLRDKEETKKLAIVFLIKNVLPFADLMLRKDWIILETNPSRPFWIGDNPVVMHNDKDFGPYGNIGFGVPGIQIYLPVTKTMTLGLYCPMLLVELDEQAAEAKDLLERTKAMSVLGARGFVPSPRELEAALSACKALIERVFQVRSRRVRCDDAHVVFLNSLQALWAERYVMSPLKEFSLVERMLSEMPQSHKGPRVTIG